MDASAQTDQDVHAPLSSIDPIHYSCEEDINQDSIQELNNSDLERVGISLDAEAVGTGSVLSLDFLNELDSANAGMSFEESKVLSSIDQLLEGLEEQRRAMVAKLHASKVWGTEYMHLIPL